MAKHRRIKLGAQRGSGTLGTFAGVFTPSILTILGIILFRRMGYVVGSAGLVNAVIMVALANAISVLTSISLAAIATNLRVKGGGDYYIISRTLGLEFGGAIGIVLFLAQSVSVAFYCIGFGEVMVLLLPPAWSVDPRVVACAAVGFLFVFAWLGADWATRFQFLVMAILGAALVSFFVGGVLAWDPVTFAANRSAPPGAPGFWLVFAIFFPAVTGFTQGVSMSGDLRDAGRSLPRGTFLAVGLSSIVYLGAAVVFAGGLGAETLRTNYGAMQRLSSIPWIIDAGVIAATLSSAMASFLGAPRILQALARDKVFRKLEIFAKGTGPTDNPRRGVYLTAAIAFAAIGLGNLNVIAPVVAMFFLISYGLLNYATYYEARAASPSFRPRFKWFHRNLSLLGALGCLGAILAINPTAGVISIALLFGIYQYLKRTAGPSRWADSSRSYQFQRIRENLFALAEGAEHPRDWRPQILALSEDDHRRERILQFANWIEGNSGLTSAVHFIEPGGGAVRARREDAEKKMREDLAGNNLTAFPLVITAPDLRTGLDQLLQGYGIGPLRANIVLLHWLDQAPFSEDPSKEKHYGKTLTEALRLERNIVILDAEDEEWATLASIPKNQRRIDVWWWGGASSRLALLLAYLMKRTDAWDDAGIRVITQGGKQSEKVLERLRLLLDEVRIEAQTEVIEKVTAGTMVEMSSDAAVVFFPLFLDGARPRDPFGRSPEALLCDLPVVAMALAAEDIELALEADQGKPAEIAESLDMAEAADKTARKAEKQAAKAEAQAEVAEARLEKLESAEENDVAEARKAAQQTRVEANREVKRAERAREKAEAATEKAEELGAPVAKKEKEEDGEGREEQSR